MVCKAVNGRCDTFICYRKDNGARWGRDIYAWMGDHVYNSDRDYGEVYYSEENPGANFNNDISLMVNSAKNIILVVTGNFTDGFPATKQAFETEDITERIVTAHEVFAIMKRFRDYYNKEPNVTKPNVYALHIGNVKLDQKCFQLLANYCVTGDYREGWGRTAEEKKLIEYLINVFMAAGIHPIDAVDPKGFMPLSDADHAQEGASDIADVTSRVSVIQHARDNNHLIYAQLREYLEDAAIEKNTVRNRSARAVPIHSPVFRYIEQKISIAQINSGNGNSSRSVRIQDLAKILINKPIVDQNNRYGRMALLSSDGGMGKTTQLRELCREYQQQVQATQDPHSNDPLQNHPTIYLYMPAKEMNQYPNESFFGVLAKYLGFHKEPYEWQGQWVDRDYSDAEEFLLARLFHNPYKMTAAPCLLCVDGLDELRSKDMLTSLMASLDLLLERGIAIIVSMRGSGLIRPNANVIYAKMNSLGNVNEYLPEAFRPHEQSRLYKLLCTPFYFTMYYETVTSERMRESSPNQARDFDALFRGAGQHGGDGQVFYHPNPETPGELIWNYLMRHIFNVTRGDEARSAATFYYLMCVLPKLALVDCDRRRTRQVSGNSTGGTLTVDDINHVLQTTWRDYCDNGWYPFWSNNDTPLYHGAQTETELSFTSFSDFCINPTWASIMDSNAQTPGLGANRLPVLNTKMMLTSGGTPMPSYEFTHAFIMDAFIALHEINDIVAIQRAISGLIRSAEMIATYGSGASNMDWPDKLIAHCQKPIFKEVGKRPILKLIAEICAEREGLPYYDPDTRQWVSEQSTRNNLIRRTLSLLGELNCLNPQALAHIPDESKEKITDFIRQSSTFVHNLYEILKMARSVDAALPDLSGVVFDGLDMTKCDMNHVIFSHHSQNGKLCASFRRATFDPELSFSKGHRAVLKDLKIAAFYELDKNYLLSVDESGYAVLTDLSLNLTVSTLSLKKTPNRYCTSNIVQDRKGTVWVACGDELFGLAFDKENGRLSIYSTRPLPTRAVKQLVIGRDGRLYYHPHTCPLDRFRMDGTPVWAPSGLWFTNSIVNRAGDTAYCFYPDDKRSLGHVSRLVRYKRNENGWCVDGTVLTNDMLGRLTNQDYYKNPVLAFSENEKTLLLSLYCKQNLNSDDAESASAGKTVAIEIDCDSIQGNLKHYSVMDRGQIVCTAYYGSNDRKFFASYLTICFVNKHCENHRLRTGTGLLTDAIFMPDTKSFLAITNNPIRIQEMGCETPSEYRCVRQIVPAFFRAKKVSSFAFKFENGLQFTKPGALGYAEHRKQLRLVLWHDDEKNIIADLSEGIETDESLSELNLIRTPVQAIVSPGQESYCLSIRGESILLNPARQSVQPILKIEVHSEWLFADCDFTDAVFSNGELPASLRHYFGLDSNADARASQTADLKKNSDKGDDEWTDLFYVDPFGDEDTEEDYCDE